MKIFAYIFTVILFSTVCFSQIPTNIDVQIVKAEDERRFDSTLENLLQNKDEKIRERAILAIGRIGDERGLEALIKLLFSDTDKIRIMSAFAIGEIESIKGADAILKVLADTKMDENIRSRAIEAAGKIVAANQKNDKSKQLSEAILENLRFESGRRSLPSEQVITFGLTAVLRAKPEKSEIVISKFLSYSSPKVRQNTLNTLGRLRTKNADIIKQVHEILLNDKDAIYRANACRILGTSEDKSFAADLLKAALNDADSRVRVSAIRALGNFKDKEIGEKLTLQGETLLKNFRANKSELLEIATSLGRILEKSNDEKTVDFLVKLRSADKYRSSETEIALFRIVQGYYKPPQNFRHLSEEMVRNYLFSYGQALVEIAKSDNQKLKDEIKLTTGFNLRAYLNSSKSKKEPYESFNSQHTPNLLQAYAELKTEDFPSLLIDYLRVPDVQIRATSASLLADLPTSKANFDALNNAFDDAFLRDKDSNDAMLAIMDALFKVNPKDSLPVIFLAFSSDDYLVRKKAFEIFKKDDSEYAKAMIERAISQGKDKVLPYKKGSKQGVVLNTNADYLRAVSRKNSAVKAVFTTEKGTFTINLMPEDAPLTVDSFIKLARKNYFNGLTVHRVVPNFVMQDGDPRGDGNGGPGYSIRCEVNMLEYERGAVGMALSGKDTGGSQWFVTHSPQPHLDGGYTVFGKVNETDMKIVDTISRGDKILTVKIIESIKGKAKNAGKR